MKYVVTSFLVAMMLLWAIVLLYLISDTDVARVSLISAEVDRSASSKPNGNPALRFAIAKPMSISSSNTHKRPVAKPISSFSIGRGVLQPPTQIRTHSYTSAKKELKPPPSVQDYVANFTRYFNKLHDRLLKEAGPMANAQGIWNAYFEVTNDTILRWEEAHKGKVYHPRQDKSIYVSMASYRDMYCTQTMKSMFTEAAHPERLFVGLAQQNCRYNCKTGVLQGGKIEDAPPDEDCYEEFCSSEEGEQICANNQIVLLRINESESLGPMCARYFVSKLYRGEQYYLQIDSHTVFDKNWDEDLIYMMDKAPSDKPVITGYPPEPFGNWRGSIGFRMCDSLFATSDIEWQIVRLEASGQMDAKFSEIPRYAPFVAAGFFFAPADFLYEVPFDPLLPYVFMGEEISISIRLWTSGYDLFSPTKNVLAHYYVRKHKPKYWESVDRFFKKPVLNQVDSLVVKRLKHMLGYPESVREMIYPASVLHNIENYAYGKVRPREGYWKMVGIDVVTKTIKQPEWCHKGQRPAIYNELGLPIAKSGTQR